MNRQSVLTKVLALLGTALVWFPILVTVIFTVIRFIERRMFQVDYLMPAELFPVALAGGGLLFWVALRARSRRRLIGWGFGIMIGMLVGGQLLAVASGLASGAVEAEGWPWVLVLASIALYTLALIEVGIAGVLLIRDLFHWSPLTNIA